MTDKVNIDDVMRALSSAVDAKAEHDKELDKYDGYSWQWHGSVLIAEKEQSMKLFGDRLNAYIDQRIQTALKNEQENF